MNETVKYIEISIVPNKKDDQEAINDITHEFHISLIENDINADWIDMDERNNYKYEKKTDSKIVSGTIRVKLVTADFYNKLLKILKSWQSRSIKIKAINNDSIIEYEYSPYNVSDSDLSQKLREMTELVIDADKYIENYNAYKDYTSNNQYDFFISHASEDKENIALPLFQILRQFGFKVWFDQAQISIGDSLVEKIQDGLSHSRYGIIIISKSFFAKKENWTKRELDALLMRDISIANTILPIWHEVEFSYVFEHSPLIASKYAIHFKKGINYVIGEILKKAEIENIIPPPIKLLAFFWRPSINKAYHTRGADVFCIVSKFFFNPKVYLHLHNNLIHESREMTYYKDLSFKLRKYSYHVYSTFIGAGENDINNFIAKASVSMTTDFGEFQDDNNSSLYLTTHMVPEFINYDAMFITQQPWMNQEIRKWTHNNEKLLGYGGRPI